MAGRRHRTATRAVAWDEAHDRVRQALEGGTRREIVQRALDAGDSAGALSTLRGEMCAHLFKTASGLVALKPVVKDFQRRTRRDGFRILHDWDGRAETFNREIIPVDMLDYCRRLGGAAQRGPEALALLLDYYFLHVLALLVPRAWDEGDPDRNLDGITELLGALQGAGGSGHRFVDDAETLLWVAISNYHPDDAAYDRLLEKVRGLGDRHRMRFAMVGAGILGSHLRWGFEAYYNRDVALLRRDNFADYPWLLFSLSTLMREYARLHRDGVGGEERDRTVGGLLNGLTADPPAFIGEAPGALADHEEEHAEFARLFREHRDALTAEFHEQRPSEEGYSPLAFHFNFPHNVLKAKVDMALTGWDAPNLPLNALVTGGRSGGEEGELRKALATALTEHSRRNPEHIRERRVMVNAYSLRAAQRSFRTLLWTEEGAEAGGPDPRASTDRLKLSPFQRGTAAPAGSDSALEG